MERSTMKNVFRTDAATYAAMVICFGLIAGCGQSASNETAGSATGSQTAPNTDAVVRAATDFLDAVLKGDTQRASARLTPQAMQRIIATGKQFAPPGLETASFRIGQVRTPTKGQAIVQCILTDNSSAEAMRNEVMCCLMRFVDNDWRVSGIAYAAGPNQQWTLMNFETGQPSPVPGQPTMLPQSPNQSVQAAPAQSRPSPPQTAQEQVPVVR
jgi:hypothetical protein